MRNTLSSFRASIIHHRCRLRWRRWSEALDFVPNHLFIPRDLATEGAESEGVEEAAIAYTAGVCNAFSGPRLWPLIEKHDFCTVDNVGLYPCYIQIFLNFTNPDYVMREQRGPLTQSKQNILHSLLCAAACSLH
ncbi:hypothetical protein ACJIZ3_022534 [Penstemon smallii]|uniref:Uncharacterized protein n=1 Tax=Penstemon smallii TaxID=265156 RepID=A0ABD3TNT7_9LAMI